MATIATALKKELKQTFPEIKFSVTTKRSTIYVEWQLEIGSPATLQAVREISERHETVEHHGSMIDDSNYSTGVNISYYPKPTQEREDWSVAGVVGHNFANAEWDAKYERFIESDGKEHYHATQLYYTYNRHGVACALINEYGGEPSEKRWYYEKLNLPTPQPEPKPVEPEVEPPIVPIAIYQVENEVYIQANFPTGNKRDWIDEYRNQATNLCQAKIVKVVHLTSEDYQAFLYSLLNDQEWLAGEGGGNSHYVSEKYGNDYDKLFSDELETKKWRRECYEISLLVTDGSQYVLVNPEGHNYAQYVGLPYHTTLEWVLEKCNIQLTVNPAEPAVINQSEVPTKQLTDEEWENEEARIETRLIELERGLEYTKPEEDQLRAELAALRQLPHTPINKSCYYCNSDEYASIRDKSYRCYVCNPEAQFEQLQMKLECLSQSEPDTEPNWMELYQQTVNALVHQCRYTEINSYEEWLAIERKRMKEKQEETALETEIWELQEKLIQLQSEYLKHKSSNN